MQNFLIIVILILVIGLSGYYVLRAKRRGEKCIGCPYSAECAAKNGKGLCAENPESN